MEFTIIVKEYNNKGGIWQLWQMLRLVIILLL